MTDPYDLDYPVDDMIDLPADDMIDLPADDMIDLPVDDMIDLPVDDMFDRPVDDVVFQNHVRLVPSFSRHWAMPSRSTFSIEPIGYLLARYVHGDGVDPFAGNSNWANYTNDINPNTTALYHLDAKHFLDLMVAQGKPFKFALLDPPYSIRQLKEHYAFVGRKLSQRDTQFSPMLNEVKDRIDAILEPDGIVISFGWNSVGMGIKRGYELLEVMLVSHGGRRHDTIVVVERKKRR